MNIATVTEIINSSFKPNEPILIEELFQCFPTYSKPQIYRFISTAVDFGRLVKFAPGVYFLPKKSSLGLGSISVDDVARKKYISDGNEIYGIYSGITLLNKFGVTSQMAGTIDIVTNNESSKRRDVKLLNRNFVVRKSRVLINKRNYLEYTVLELFSLLEPSDLCKKNNIISIRQFCYQNNVDQNGLLSMCNVFPPKTVKKLIGSGLLDGMF